MCAHNDARTKLKYLAYFPAQGVFRALGTDVSPRNSFQPFMEPNWVSDFRASG
jgi:hypothetical protein